MQYTVGDKVRKIDDGICEEIVPVGTHGRIIEINTNSRGAFIEVAWANSENALYWVAPGLVFSADCHLQILKPSPDSDWEDDIEFV